MSREHRAPEVNVPRARMLLARVDGSVVTTSNAITGLDLGGANMLVAKGSGGASNEVTITFNQPFAAVPVVQATPITTNCHIEIKSVAVGSVVLETFQVADGTTGVDDADMHVMIVGPLGSGEMTL